MGLWKLDGKKIVERLLDAPDDIEEMKSWLATCQQKGRDSALRQASGMLRCAIIAASGQQHARLTESERGQQRRQQQEQQQQQQRQSQSQHSSAPPKQKDRKRRHPVPAKAAPAPTAPPTAQQIQVDLLLISILCFTSGGL